jgi:hypothetical protein
MTQIVLRSALCTRDYKAQMHSPIERGSNRIAQYRDNAIALLHLVPEIFAEEVLVVDNTVQSVGSLESTFGKIFPNGVRYLASATNTFGRFNKGDSETYRYLLRSGTIHTDFLHLELRLRPIESGFIKEFLEAPNSMARVNHDGSILSGCVGYSINDALDFFPNWAKPLSMSIKRSSIEHVLARFWERGGLSVWHGEPQFVRYDPMRGAELY